MKNIHELLSKIKIGLYTNANYIEINFKNQWLPVLNILYKEGYIQNFIVKNRKFYIYFRFYQNKNSIKTLTALKKNTYVKNRDIWLFNRFGGILIISTIYGLKTHIECAQIGLGGKVLFLIC